MNRYECSTSYRTPGNDTPTREIEAQTESEAATLYKQEVGLDRVRAVVNVRFIGKVQADRFSRFTR